MTAAGTQWLRRFLACGCVAALCFAPWRSPVGAAEPLMVNGVAVEATAATAALARDMAIADGQRRAFQELIDHLAPGADSAALAKLPDAEIAPLVAGFEVADERVSATRWRAVLSFAFDQDAVRALLRDERQDTGAHVWRAARDSTRRHVGRTRRGMPVSRRRHRKQRQLHRSISG
jgi:hypothetical protein